jgi:hypothetical protein
LCISFFRPCSGNFPPTLFTGLQYNPSYLYTPPSPLSSYLCPLSFNHALQPPHYMAKQTRKPQIQPVDFVLLVQYLNS